MAICGCFGKGKNKKNKSLPKDEVDKPDKPLDDKPPTEEVIKVSPANGTVAAVEPPAVKEEPVQQTEAPPPPQEPPPPPPVTKKVDLEQARKEFFEDMYSPNSSYSQRHVCFGKHEPANCDTSFCYQKLEQQKQVLHRLELKEQRDGLTPEEQQEVANMTAELKTLIDRLEAVAMRIEKTAPAAVAAASALTGSGAASPATSAYGNIVTGSVQKFCDLSKKLQGDIAILADLVKEAFEAQEAFVAMASRSQQPSQQKLMELLKPQSELISKIQDFREKNRRSVQFNHLSAISESIPAIGWVAVTPAPGPYVKEMSDAGQFYTNRVLKEWKEKDKSHVEWVRAWLECLSEVQAYIKQHHTTGLVWNPAGGEPSLPGGMASVGGAPPPPPPPGPPPPPPPVMPPAQQQDLNIDRSALFAEINQGQDITKGLKKVTADMQTHKNPTLRAGPAPFKAPGPKPYQPPAQTASSVKPPLMQLDGKKWLVEYQKDAPGLTISDTSMNQSVYMYRCEKSTLQVKGKVNSIIMDSCKKSAVVFDSVVASVEFVNCQSVQMQVMGQVPTISVDKCDGVQMYLSEDSLNVEIVSSKSSEMNVLIPTPAGDMNEIPVPEQYKTTIENGRLKTVCTESI